jgi:hypothetical protein
VNWLSKFTWQVWDWLDEMHLRWALRELPPTHPAIPPIVLRLRRIEDRRGA